MSTKPAGVELPAWERVVQAMSSFDEKKKG